uniref:non-specific serine/threonine protein kinase n=1 Tax=Cajanus cajan TaxID=3821 RepID=A0A151S0K3_CAJCA|nr:Lectin-domain containing receptor kinase A4.2 [Cajanus cajan]
MSLLSLNSLHSTLFMFCFINVVTAATEFDFGTLTLGSLKLLGDAHLNNGTVSLTRDLAVPTSGAGRALYSRPVRFRQPGNRFPASFTTFFSFSVANLNPSSIGGGLAFLLSPDDETIGDAGGFLGLSGGGGGGGAFLAVEFDTLMDVEFNDINGNHVGVDLNSVVSSEVGDLASIGIDLKSGDLINAWIEFDGSSKGLSVWVSYSNLKPKDPFLTMNLDVDKYLNDFMYVGFSGSTQGSTEVHRIEWWSFGSSFETPLPWPHRRKILLGVASALAYLHQECENQVIHRDIKTSNIMLDEGFNARLGDFGLARQTEHDKSPDATVAAGTMGYLAPEYLLTGKATEKTDVFSYGAVVLEVASGRRPIEKDANGGGKGGISCNLVEWVWSLHREGRLLMAADRRLEGEFDEGEMRRLLLVGLACSHPDPLARPTMRGVVQMLVGEAEVPIVPRTKPSAGFSTSHSHLLLSLQDSVSDCDGIITISTSTSEDSFNLGDLV